MIFPETECWLEEAPGNGGLLMGSRRGWQLALREDLLYQAGRGRDGETIPASRTARMPVRKMPSKVPAPPMGATGAPRPLILSRLERSAPINVPIEPPI